VLILEGSGWRLFGNRDFEKGSQARPSRSAKYTESRVTHCSLPPDKIGRTHDVLVLLSSLSAEKTTYSILYKKLVPTPLVPTHLPFVKYSTDRTISFRDVFKDPLVWIKL
jgi:hypothetical protein